MALSNRLNSRVGRLVFRSAERSNAEVGSSRRTRDHPVRGGFVVKHLKWVPHILSVVYKQQHVRWEPKIKRNPLQRNASLFKQNNNESDHKGIEASDLHLAKELFRIISSDARREIDSNTLEEKKRGKTTFSKHDNLELFEFREETIYVWILLHDPMFPYKRLHES
jgi:hypothetical protein